MHSELKGGKLECKCSGDLSEEKRQIGKENKVEWMRCGEDLSEAEKKHSRRQAAPISRGGSGNQLYVRDERETA